MSQQDLLYKTPGTLRAPWRLGIFIVAALAAALVLNIAVSPILARVFAAVGAPKETAGSWVTMLSLLIATFFTVRLVDHKPWSHVWLGKDEAQPGFFLAGFLIGALAIAVPTGILVVAGWLANDGGDSGSWFAAMARVSLLLLPAAFLEELLTRGYILSVLRETWGWKWAIIVTSLAFGIMHVLNSGASLLPILLVTLAGFFLAGVLYVTKSLYATWFAHFAWNWTMAAAFHVSVSGIPMEKPNYHYVDAGPDWATGGPWGPEGGVPAGLGMAAGMVFLYSNKQRREAEAEIAREKNKLQ